MRAVVTGAAGFIGSALVRRLVEQTDLPILAIDALTDYYSREQKLDNLRTFPGDRVEVAIGDLNDIDLGSLLVDAKWIFHQAGQPGVRKSWGSDFSTYADHNIRATQRLLEHSRELPYLQSLVYASSSSVYGDAESYPTTEQALPRPRSPYGVTKLAAEHLCALYGTNYGVPTVALRYFTVYGPGQRPDMAFNRFIQAALNSRPVTIYGDGHQIREFTYVGDIVEANIRAASAGVAPGTVINLSGGASVSVRDVLAALEQIHGSTIAMEYSGAVAGDVFRTGGSTERARDLLDWQPTVELEQGLSLEYDWLAASSRT